MDETSRHNVAGEGQAQRSLEESIRHNKATEEEAKRHNIVGEQYDVKALNETGRHNRAQEMIGRSQVGASYANITLGYQQLGETERSNLARETETNRSNVARETENTRSNTAREEETLRHNRTGEAIDMYRNRSEAQYRRDLIRQGGKKLQLDAWKTGVQTADTIIKGVGTFIPLLK